MGIDFVPSHHHRKCAQIPVNYTILGWNIFPLTISIICIHHFVACCNSNRQPNRIFHSIAALFIRLANFTRKYVKRRLALTYTLHPLCNSKHLILLKSSKSVLSFNILCILDGPTSHSRFILSSKLWQRNINQNVMTF